MILDSTQEIECHSLSVLFFFSIWRVISDGPAANPASTFVFMCCLFICVCVRKREGERARGRERGREGAGGEVRSRG